MAINRDMQAARHITTGSKDGTETFKKLISPGSFADIAGGSRAERTLDNFGRIHRRQHYYRCGNPAALHLIEELNPIPARQTDTQVDEVNVWIGIKCGKTCFGVSRFTYDYVIPQFGQHTAYPAHEDRVIVDYQNIEVGHGAFRHI